MKVSIVTLGCGRNEVDSDQLAGMFSAAGHDVVDDADAAEVVLVNTCTFVAPAKQESIDTVLAACDLKQDNARAVLVVGCMAQRYPHELAESIPEADAIVGFDAYPQLVEIASGLLTSPLDDRVVGITPESVDARTTATTAAPKPALLPLLVMPSAGGPQEVARQTALRQDELDRIPASGPRVVRRFSGGPWAYVKIASGCDRACTFCAIPSFRGGFRSRPIEEIVAETAWLIEQGAREVVLVSENTTSFGKDLADAEGRHGRDWQPALLERLHDLEGLERIRLMYLQPDELRWPLVEAIADLPKVASYYDLSLQHVSAPVVRRMARGGSVEEFRDLIGRIRQRDPGAVFRSNFILGFPGETEEDVNALESFLSDQRIDWVGLFTFSEEDGTPSATYDDQVPEDVALERLRRIADVQEIIADNAAADQVGRDLEVLVDEVGPDICAGRSYREAPETDGEVRLVTKGAVADLPVGRMVTARVIASDGVDLIAELETGRR